MKILNKESLIKNYFFTEILESFNDIIKYLIFNKNKQEPHRGFEKKKQIVEPSKGRSME